MWGATKVGIKYISELHLYTAMSRVITRMQINILTYDHRMYENDQYMGLVECYNKDNVCMGTLQGPFWKKDVPQVWNKEIIDGANEICRSEFGQNGVSENCTYYIQMYSTQNDWVNRQNGISITSQNPLNPYLITIM